MDFEGVKAAPGASIQHERGLLEPCLDISLPSEGWGNDVAPENKATALEQVSVYLKQMLRQQ